MGDTLIFQLLYRNVLNYRYFQTVQRLFEIKKNVGKNKKTLKNAFLYKIKKYLNVYYN